MIDFKEYTKQRDIAQKRIKRMQKSGIKINVHIPTVKEIRSSTEAGYVERMFSALSEFVTSGISLARRKEARRVNITPEQRKQQKREYQRDYRRKKVAREYQQSIGSKRYEGYVLGLKTLGVDIPPSKLPAFFEYMDYRFAQGNVSKKYVFDIFVDDYQTMLQKGYSPDKILSDFDLFLSNQMELEERKNEMNGYGMTAEKAISLWDKYISR